MVFEVAHANAADRRQKSAGPGVIPAGWMGVAFPPNPQEPHPAK